VIQRAREELSKITGLELSSTLSSAKVEQGWKVQVELIEKHSIPDGMDLLATYEAVMDDFGNLLSFRRVRMRKRIDSEVEFEEE
ncbi:MAG: gas vesicle protein GvpO, partial [Dehalococcoidales bacterium]|nr:gas vesicle protein GvpO [Dehalococcoidales bacterium]